MFKTQNIIKGKENKEEEVRGGVERKVEERSKKLEEKGKNKLVS